jgi:esterase/lipase superfamily enzyme
MELLVFGHAGARLLVFPTSMGRFFDWENRAMPSALSEQLENGWIQMICVDSVDTESWYAWHKSPADRAWRHIQYDNYLVQEVIPFIANINSTPFLITTGASFGAYHAMNFALRHPDITNRVISMSGMFNIERWLGDYRDEPVYQCCPCLYMPNENEEGRLNLLRRLEIIIAVGQDDPNIANNRWFTDVLSSKGLQPALRVWDGWSHDWPFWQQMIRLYIAGKD